MPTYPITLRWLASFVAVITSGVSVPPPARTVPYVATFYGTQRSDPYHWMEAGGPELKAYLEEQSAFTYRMLHDNPGRAHVLATIRSDASSAGGATSTNGVMRVGSRVYYLQNEPGGDAPSLLVRIDGKRASSVVVAARSLPKGTVIGWFAPSPNGSKIAYGATASSEFATVHVCDADGSKDTAQAIEPSVIPYASWYGEKAFYYPTVHASATDRTEVSYFHVVGAKKGADVAITGFGARGPMGSSTDRHLFSSSYTVLDRDAVVATISHDVTPQQAVFIAPFDGATSANGAWRRLFSFDDQIIAVAVAGKYVYGLTDRGNARRSIVVKNRTTGATVRTIPPGAGFRSLIFANGSGLFTGERIGADMRLERFDAAGNALGAVAIPPANAITSIDGDPQMRSFALQTSSFDDPTHWYEIGGRHDAVRTMSVNPLTPQIYSRLRYVNAFAPSADGTKIPYTVIYRAGTPKDGMRPTAVVGYGAYGFDIEPPVPPEIVALLDLGVVVVLAHARGGGEFGEPWHLAGKGHLKQHTIDDFIACAQAAIDTGWTSHAKLAGYGESAGGITIGGAITQHPELFAAAISEVGFSDMVDLEKMPNGPGNVPEFGSVKTEQGFRDLLAMSAYDHVVPAAYPATILTTGLSDQRNAPWQVAKMAARLQASTTSGKPVLLRADEQGHGVVLDPSAQFEQFADEFTFMLWQLGEPGFDPA